MVQNQPINQPTNQTNLLDKRKKQYAVANKQTNKNTQRRFCTDHVKGGDGGGGGGGKGEDPLPENGPCESRWLGVSSRTVSGRDRAATGTDRTPTYLPYLLSLSLSTPTLRLLQRGDKTYHFLRSLMRVLYNTRLFRWMCGPFRGGLSGPGLDSFFLGRLPSRVRVSPKKRLPYMIGMRGWVR